MKLPLATRKGTGEGGALGQEGRGSLGIIAAGLEEGPLEARRTAPGTDSLSSGPLQLAPPGCCLPVLGGRRPLAVGVGLCLCSLWLRYT